MKNFKCNLTQRMFCVMLAIAVVFSGLCIPQNAKTVEAASPVVEQAISWAISIANDNSHGYSMTSRWGPDYDCSSFVISAYSLNVLTNKNLPCLSISHSVAPDRKNLTKSLAFLLVSGSSFNLLSKLDHSF